jgi:hypothetical protein
VTGVVRSSQEIAEIRDAHWVDDEGYMMPGREQRPFGLFPALGDPVAGDYERLDASQSSNGTKDSQLCRINPKDPRVVQALHSRMLAARPQEGGLLTSILGHCENWSFSEALNEIATTVVGSDIRALENRGGGEQGRPASLSALLQRACIEPMVGAF